MPNNKIQFRADPELNEAFDAYIASTEAESGVALTRAEAARQLMRAALGTPAVAAASQEAIMLLVRVQQRLVASVTQIMQTQVQDVLQEELGADGVVD